MDDPNMHAYGEDGPDDAEIGRQWRENSSLERWFPITAERLAAKERENLAQSLADARAEIDRLNSVLVNYRASHDALRDWAQECRDQVLYLLAQQDNELGRVADGLGQSSAGLLGPNVEVKAAGACASPATEGSEP